MAALKLKATVTADRQLKVDLPTTLQPGSEIEITLELPVEEIPWEQHPWTDHEIQAMMEEYRHPTPKTGAEIVALLQEMGGEGWDQIEDGAAWVEKQRREEQERSQW